MIIRLLDYADKSVVVDVGDIDAIAKMRIRVLSGDEVLHVIYKDHSEKIFDSSHSRMIDYREGDYEIYNHKNPDGSTLFREEFVNRTESHWFWYEDWVS